ncbi:hypothetical protein V8B97DRAFT_1923593 [Scleroderma yunnanense]
MTFMNVVFLFPTTPNTSAIDMNYTVVVLGAPCCLWSGITFRCTELCTGLLARYGTSVTKVN